MRHTWSLQHTVARVLSLFFLLTLVFHSRPIQAQFGATPLAQSPGSPAGSFALSDIDTVNLFNGHVSVRLPILIAQGRGNASGQITFNWGSPANYHIRTDVDPNNGSPLNYVEPGGGGAFSIDGFSTGFAQVYGIQAGSVFTTHCHMDHSETHQKSLTRLFFVEPDGTEHEMRDVQTGGQPFSVPVCAMNGSSRGKVFVSTDGSGATFIADDPVIDNVYSWGYFPIIGPTGYLMLRDGSRYRINDPMTMRDRNGNLLTETFDPYPIFQYKIKDSINRLTTHDLSVACPSPITGNCQKLSYKGYNGATRNIWLKSGSPTRLILPNNLEYKFHLNGYGDLSRIDLPTGGYIEYDYGPGVGGPQPDPYAWIQGLQNDVPGTYPIGPWPGVVYRRVTERRVYKEGGVLDSRQTFSKPEYYDGVSYVPSNLGYVDKKQYDANNNILNTERHFFYGAATNSFSLEGTDYPSWKDAREYRLEFYNQSGTLIRTTNVSWEQRAAVPWWGGGSDSAPQNDPRVSQTQTILETGQSTTTVNSYDPLVPYNSLIDEYVYDYSGALLRRTQTAYVKTLNGTDYTGANITSPNAPYMRDLPAQISVFDGGGERGRTSFEYDNYSVDATHAALVPRTSISGLDASFGTSYSFRGNVTKINRSLLSGGVVTGSSLSYLQYDVAGNVVKAIDPRGYPSTIYLTDNFGGPNGEARTTSAPTELTSVGQFSYAFPTLVMNALNHATYTQFDYYLGQPVDVENPNGVTSSGVFNDPLDRTTQVIKGANQSTTVKSQVSFSYNDAARTVTTTSDLSVFNDPNPLKNQKIYDSLGRMIETRTYEGGSNYITSQTQFDALGRPFKTSNPFRPWQSESPVWTTRAFDAMGRVTSVTYPDNAVTSTSYNGNAVTTTDPAGRATKTVTDALGRLTFVYEDPSGLNYQTSYAYDALDSLTTVTQGSQTRTFVYDSLKRLTSVTNPESGSTTYQYDASGNLTQKTDARGVVSTYVYDALNRNTSIDYSDATADVFRQYDLAVLGIGRLNQTWQSGSTTSATNIDSYDALGRPLVQRQRYETAGVWSTYQTSRTYNQAGDVISQTYPSGRTVNYTYDAAGRTRMFTGTLGDGASRTYANNLDYASFGGLIREQYGASTTLYHKLLYNVRGQLFDKRLSSVNDLWDWNRGRLILYYSGNHVWGQSGTDNNGNIRFAETWIPPENATLDQATTLSEDIYEYDTLNRLKSVTEQRMSASGGWVWQTQFKQTYDIDRYGNRTINGNAAQTWGLGINNKQFAVNAGNNRLGVPGGQAGVMSYDNAGNLTTDTYTGYGGANFDAQNKITSIQDALGGWSYYTYDGDGRRTRKKVNNQETRLIYGFDSELLAEYASTASVSTPQKEYGYRNGQLLVTAGPSPCGAGFQGTKTWSATGANIYHATGQQDGTDWAAYVANHSSHAMVYGPYDTAFGGGSHQAQFLLQVDNNNGSDVIATLDVAIGSGATVLAQRQIRRSDFTAANQWQWFTVDFANPCFGTVEARVWWHDIANLKFRELKITSGSPSTIQWLVADQLGTPRMVVDQTGSLANMKRHDYLPFGEELIAPTGGRQATWGYSGGDGVRQQFTQQERDVETGLDYFQARYYSSVQGRFTSADEPFADQAQEDPQSWNLYQYAGNNPLRFNDPSGMWKWVDPDQNGNRFLQWEDGDNWQTLTTFLNNNSNDTYYREDVEAAFASGGLGEGTIVDVTGVAPKFTNSRGGVDSSVSWDLVPFGGPARGAAKTGILKRIARAFGIGSARQSVRIVTRRALPVIVEAVCFVAGTPVMTKDGLKPIEEIKAGDQVLSYNEQTKQPEYKTVVQTTTKFAEAGSLLTLDVRGADASIEVTRTHPFYVRERDPSCESENGEWRQAHELLVGDEIKSVSGNWIKVLRLKQRKGGALVYNFEVSDNHNYYVGQTGLLVHNDCLPAVIKAVNSKLPHAAKRAVERGFYTTEKEAADALRALSKQITEKGFPEGTILDPDHVDRVLVPLKDGALAAYQVGSNGTAHLKTVLIAK